MGIKVRVGYREPVKLALKRLRRLMEKDGIIREEKRRRSFVQPAEQRRRKQFKKQLKSRQTIRKQ
jgi:ribosomal protein S21